MSQINVKATIQIPRTPKYLMFGDGESKIDIADVTDDSLRELGEEWIEVLVTDAQTRRAARKGAVDV